MIDGIPASGPSIFLTKRTLLLGSLDDHAGRLMINLYFGSIFRIMSFCADQKWVRSCVVFGKTSSLQSGKPQLVDL